MITDLTLTNFRNHTERQLSFATVTVLIGPNGAGKTNVLEALAMLSLTTSWRTDQDSEVITWGEPFARVVSGARDFVVQRSPYRKRYRIDGVSKRTAEVLGTLPSVLFHPDDVQLLYGAPAYRRQYMDRVLAQVSPRYAEAVTTLSHVLRQRNRLLKLRQAGMASDDELVFWDSELARLHAIIQPFRQRYVAFLYRRAPELFTELVPGDGTVSCVYHSSPRQAAVSIVGSADGAEVPEDTTIEVDFLHHLNLSRGKEVVNGATLYGPHREDILFSYRGYPVAASLSRGQGRALILALKVAELEYLDAQLETKPIFLLDDVLSELDRERQEKVFTVCTEYQTVITTVEVPENVRVKMRNAEVVEIR